MLARSLAPLLAASLIAGPAWAQDSKADKGQNPDKFVPVSEVTDVTPDHWAYPALKSLVEKYQILGVFPDGTFRGTKFITRYEAAAALGKIMTRMEEMVVAAGAQAGGDQAAPAAPGKATVTPDDLRTIARLQQEFKDELATMAGRLDTFDQRLLNLEKRLRLGGDLQIAYRTYTPADKHLGPDQLRIGTGLKLGADLAPELAYTGHLQIFGNGVQSLANGHQANDGGALEEQRFLYFDQAAPFYVCKSYVSWTPPSLAVHAGLFSVADVMPVGSTLSSAFANASVWPNAEGGYGFVGTPPLQSIGPSATPADFRIKPFESPTNAPGSSPLRTQRVPYHPGINVVQDLLDPNSARDVNFGSAGGLAVVGTLGPMELGAAVHNGVPGARSAVALTELPNTFPLISDPNDGYGLAKAGVDLGIFRASVVGRADNAVLGQLAKFDDPRGKGWGLTADLGSDVGGLSLGYAAMTRSGNDRHYYSEASAALTSTNFLGLGIGAGLATKIGSAPLAGSPDVGPNPGLASLTGSGGQPRSPIIPAVSYNWSSSGLYIKFPGFSLVPTFTIAAQSSGWDLLDSNFGSGLTAIAEIQPHPALPRLFLQYDLGKFSTDPRRWNALVGKEDLAASASVSPITHEQYVLGTQIRF
ncbi:MAG: S-layer homology domain-containing protein [Candidatus Sericytochromatia bacterium]|nr:S-layer homology domain-containing protein [Candidatus Tanganyikabacteria bacterium]